MKIFVKIGYIITSLLFIAYLLLPSSSFPTPPGDSIQSIEPADSENFLRRAYFTDMTREEVILFYQEQFKINLPDFLLLRLNYPPEDSQILIRDQTRSTFLEELSYPLRDSLYINGFEPKEAKDEIWYQGRHFRQKITVKYVSSSIIARLVISLGISVSSWMLIKQYLKRV